MDLILRQYLHVFCPVYGNGDPERQQGSDSLLTGEHRGQGAVVHCDSLLTGKYKGPPVVACPTATLHYTTLHCGH